MSTIVFNKSSIRPWQAATGLTYLALIGGAWLAIHVWGVFGLEVRLATLPLVLLLMIVQCWLSVGLFIVAHDAMHGSLVPGHPRTNEVLGRVILFLYAGFSWRPIRAAHMAHHRYAGTERDPDFHAGDPERFWPWYGVFMRRYFGLRPLLFVCTVVAVYLVVLRAAPVNVVLLYGLPAIASSLQLFYFGTYLPHRHEDEDGFADGHNARSSAFGPLVSLLTCFHFGYHHPHHLTPGTPWWALPEAMRAAQTPQETVR